jgi:tol-pal system protein YbgF
MTRYIVLAAAVFLLVPASPASATDKEHRLIMADIRMLQEQTQQLQLLLGNLTDALKTVSAKLDEQASADRKAFADQRLLVAGVGDNVRILREKVDDTNVRLSSVTQQLEGVRQAIRDLPPPAPVVTPTDPTAAPGTQPQAPPVAPPPAPAGAGASPDRLWTEALNDYYGGQYDLAISGFEAYLKYNPKSVMADDAQFHIGQAQYLAKRFKEAIEAYNRLISTYPASEHLADAYYKRGLSHEGLGEVALARESYEFVLKTYPPEHHAVSLAKQGLDRVSRK